MKMETLRRLRYITKPNDHFISFDLQDGFYALSIHPKNREAFTVNLDGHLLQLCAWPMGWSLSPYTFHKFTGVFVNKLRDPEATTRPGCLPNLSAKAKKKWFRRRHMLKGTRLLPFVDDFAVFATGFDETMRHKDETCALVNSLGLNIHSTKGYHTATQVGEHLGMEMDIEQGVFRAPVKKLKDISVIAKNILCTATANKRWVHVKALASLAGKAKFLHLAIQVVSFYLRELHPRRGFPLVLVISTYKHHIHHM